MTQRTRKAIPVTDAPAYPSLSEHCRSRRQFLAGGAALLGASTLAACTRPFGNSGNHENIPGDIEQPDYFPLRFPATGTASVWLMDGGYATYYVTAVTYDQDVALFVDDQRAALEQRIATTVSERSYDELVTASGTTMDALRDAVADTLNTAYNEDTGDSGSDWFREVQVIFERLDPPVEIGGVAGEEPAYP